MAHAALSAHTRSAGSPEFLISRQSGLTKVVRLTALRVLYSSSAQTTGQLLGTADTRATGTHPLPSQLSPPPPPRLQLQRYALPKVAVATNRCRRDSLLPQFALL